MERRTFIKNMLLLAVANQFIANPLYAASKFQKLKCFGIITGNTGGKWLEGNPIEALKFISDCGYKELEFEGDFGLGQDRAKKYIKDLGLIPLIGGAAMYGITQDTQAFAKSIKDSLDWGKKYFACYYPFLDGNQKVPIEEWKRICDRLNKAGKICKENGLKLLYHNHFYEFQLTEGSIPYDIVLQYTDPDLISMEMDLYWVAKASRNPIDFMKKYPNRFEVLHVKDMDYTLEKGFAYVGQGQMNFENIFSYSQIAGVKHYIVECDEPKNNKDCIHDSAVYLRNMKYALI